MLAIAGWCAALVLSACTGPSVADSQSTAAPLPTGTIGDFAADWQAGRTQDASLLTTTPASAAQAMSAVSGDLGATSLNITTGAPAIKDGTARVTATMTWTLPAVGRWSYDTDWQWVRHGDGATARWLLDFTAHTIHPDLGPGQTLAVRTEGATDGPIVDRNDTQLVSPIRVYSVVLLVNKIPDISKTSAVLAVLLEPLDHAVTAKSIVDGVAAAKADGLDSYTVTNIRESDFAPLEEKLTSVPGVTLPSQVRALPPTAGFASMLLASVLPVATKMAAGTPGWRIDTVDMNGDDLTILAEKPADPGTKVTVTLDPAVQSAAQAAVDPVAEPAVIVAIAPSTGEILAVAQNKAADALGLIALKGQYPPGSTFKIVTATAAIDHNLIAPTTAVSCPGEWTTNNRTIHNEGFALGTVTATSAFAHSCNTTFAMLASQMPAGALPSAASEYGIGLDFDIAGITTLTGSVQAGDSVLARAENGFGQGTDLVTPFSSALMAATAATGSMPTPVLIRGTTTTVDHPAPKRSAAVQAGIRTLMRAVVTDGTAKSLRGDGEVYAKTGTAEYLGADGKIHAHAWTVGFRGDIAFSAMIVGGDSSKRTNDLAHAMLTALPAN
ncbi:MAG: penicillin-binding transpeptidase domain-containing protein [Nakamurella sp.]